MHHSDADLDALEAMLTSLPDSGAGMLVSEFDGFCTGVLVCPEPISPSEWLPLVLGGEHLFPDPKAAQRAVDLVMSHYKRVDLALVPPATHYEAILETDPSTGETLWGLWISGFASAFSLRPDCWNALEDSDDSGALQAISVFIQLHMVAEKHEGLDDGTIAYLSDTAPSLIPDMVTALNDWTRSQGGPRPEVPETVPSDAAEAPAQPPILRARPRSERSDPCPCGSGRAHVRCCGAN